MSKQLEGSYSRLIENYFFLAALQATNFLIPLIILPYLVRVLGMERFGLIAFAQAFTQYFIIITDYGFNLSATREISIYRGDHKRVSVIFCSVMVIRFVLLVVCAMVFFAIISGFSKFQIEWELYLFSFGLVVGNLLFPVWFFQGMEKMKYITYFNLSSKIVSLVAILFFIQRASDYLYVPLINSVGLWFSGLASLLLIKKQFKVGFILPSRKYLTKYFLDSTSFFLSRISLSIYTATNTFALGIFTNNQMVGLYSSAEKLYLALQQLYTPLVNTLYPYISRNKNITLFKRVFFYTNLINTGILLIVFTFAPEIVNLLFGEGMEVIIFLLRVFSIIAFVMVPSILLGFPLLAALGLTNYANGSVILGSMIHLSGLAILISFNQISVYSVVYMVLLTETIVIIIRIMGAAKLRKISVT